MLGCLFDVHGNLPALEAVLSDARSLGVERFVLGGDYAALGAWPEACVETLAGLDVALRIRGNWERWVADPPDDVRADAETMEAVEAVRSALGDDLVATLAAPPDRGELDDGLVCHASPAGDMQGFAPEPADDDDELLAGSGARRLIVGHTHVQYTRTTASGVSVTNPGSVGMPVDGDARAAWAWLRDDGSLELRRVPYDVDTAIDALRKRHGDVAWAAMAARRLATARM
jgi:diadenosine tetraphosphatase ApaH/serine/threonine PP2A family protein phosphatase